MSNTRKFYRNQVEYKLYCPDDMRFRWYVEWEQSGKRKRRYTGMNHLDTYNDRLKAAEKVLEGLYVLHGHKVTKIEEKIKAVLEAKRPKWRKSTYVQNKGVVDAFFIYMKGQEPTRALIDAFFEELGKTKHPTTINKYRGHLNQMFTAAGAPGRFAHIEQEKGEKTPARYFQAHQVEELAAWMRAKDNDLWRFVQLQYYCFIRPRELRMLQAEDVMLGEAKILVPSHKSKNGKSQYVTIPDALLPDLDWVKKLRPNHYLFHISDPTKPLGQNTMGERHRKMLRELGYGSAYKLYSWKHTGAVAAVKAGSSIKEVQMQLRHHSLDETDQYLRQMGVGDMATLKKNFPSI